MVLTKNSQYVNQKKFHYPAGNMLEFRNIDKRILSEIGSKVRRNKPYQRPTNRSSNRSKLLTSFFKLSW